jgi:hypothetical protein
MAQAISRRLLTAEAWVRSWVSACGIGGGKNGTGTGFTPSTSVFPSVSFHRCSITRKKVVIFIFITGLHNKPLKAAVHPLHLLFPPPQQKKKHVQDTKQLKQKFPNFSLKT